MTAGSIPGRNGGNDAEAESSSSLPLPQAKRQKPTVAPAGAEEVSLHQVGDRELREQVMKQSRLIADMAKELEALRKERAAEGVAAENSHGGRGVSVGGGAGGESLAVPPVRKRAQMACAEGGRGVHVSALLPGWVACLDSLLR